MKKTGILTLAAFLFVGFSFLAVDNVFAQTGQTAASISEQQFLLNSIKQVLGSNVTMSDAIPPVIMLDEPKFTSGSKNIVYWQPLPDTVIVAPAGVDIKIPREKVFIFISASFDSLAKDTLRIVSGAVDSIEFDDSFWSEGFYDNTIFYWAQLVVEDPSNPGSPYISGSRTIVYSHQDITKPTIGRFIIGDSLRNEPESGWFNDQDVYVWYENLADAAGLSSAVLNAKNIQINHEFKSFPDGQPGPPSEDSSFVLTNLPGGPLQVTLSACDAAYSANNHGAGEGIASFWDFDYKNCAEHLAAATIKVDREAPLFDFTGVKVEYNSSDLEADRTIKFSFFVIDTLSGIDVESIIVEFINSDMLFLLEQTINADDGAFKVKVSVVIGGIPEFGINEQITLKVTAADRAGNVDSTLREITVNINPVEFTYELYDLSVGDDFALEGCTNDRIVGWRFLTVEFDTNKIAKVVFMPNDGSGRSVEWQPNQPQLLNLEAIYPTLNTDTDYIVYVAVTLVDGVTSKHTALPSDTLYFDNTAPTTGALTLTDIDLAPPKAHVGFTNSDTVDVKFVAIDFDSVINMRVEGDVKCIIRVDKMECNTNVVPYDSVFSITLDKRGEPEKEIGFSARDKAGNWSESMPGKIVLLQQDIIVEILGDNPIVVTKKQGSIEASVKITAKYPKYFNYGTTQDTLITVGDRSDSCEQVGDMFVCIIDVNFSISDSFDTFTLTDLAGNVSNTDTLFFSIQTPPEISLVLYDYSEFDSSATHFSDSLYTDVGEENETKINARVIRDDGAWNSIRLAFDYEDIYSKEWQNVQISQSIIDVPLNFESIGEDCVIRVKAQARNSNGDTSKVDSATIIHDTVAPKLISFSAGPLDGFESLPIIIEAYDSSECYSGLAGIVVRDSAASTREIKWFYLPWSNPDRVIDPIDANGLHYVSAFVVDNADVDQDARTVSELGKIGHSSDTLRVIINIQSNTKIAYNYPNPFYPPIHEVTNFQFTLEKEGTVDIQIFDLFGNLVWEEFRIFCPKITDAQNNGVMKSESKLTWNGTNKSGVPVASGIYIAIIKPENESSLKPIKIGVLRKN
jgi:hypothetical protein